MALKQLPNIEGQPVRFVDEETGEIYTLTDMVDRIPKPWCFVCKTNHDIGAPHKKRHVRN